MYRTAKSKWIAAEDNEELRIPHRQPDGARPSRWIPGELGIWVFVFTDLIMFSAYFGAVMHERSNHEVVFSAGRASMNTGIGVTNTFLLLTASLFIALAAHSTRGSAGRTARNLLLGAGICGAIFVVNKGIEWSGAVGDGHTPQTNIFFQMYYVLTGVHLLHVVIALALLVHLWRLTGRIHGKPGARQLRFFENGALFWHLTDILWLVLFTLFYLAR